MRSLNRLLALVLGLAVAAAAAVTGVEVGLLVSGRPSWVVPRSRWDDLVSDLGWDDRGLVIAAVVVLVAGLLLLVAQLVPRRPSRLQVRSDRPDREVWISRRGLEGQLRRAAEREPPVQEARVRLSRRRVKVTAAVPRHSPPSKELGPGVRSVVGERLEEARLVQPPKLKVRLRPTGHRLRPVGHRVA